ncbi:DUF1254 domain-containing protein [Paenibacillus sp. NPDC056579]|uniref:DUF1254 domain-containing protein n=1 Tax=Paenibacillus sp. NPDC056579 TaxID=3345871 RepID=UPI003676F1D4
MNDPQFSEMRNFSRSSGDTSLYNRDKLSLDALDVYVYGFPLVLMDITRRTGAVSIPQRNRFYNQKVLATPKFSHVVRPNVDTLYSSAWLDLSRGPLQLHVPDTLGRYYLLPMLDAWSNVFASVGSRTTGNSERSFLIVGPGWQGSPSGADIIHAPTDTVWIIGRTQTNGPEDYPAVHAIQRGFQLTRQQPVALNTPNSDHILIIDKSPSEIVKSMDAAVFFNLMMELMYRNPPYPHIQSPEITHKLHSLGLIPGPGFNFSKLEPQVQKALAQAVRSGPEIINRAGEQLLADTGWSMPMNNIGYYGTHYWDRAIIANTLFGANIPEDAVYAYAFSDSNGNALDGSNQYVIHFAPGRLPPVHAFWSITLYNKDGYLVKNPLNRYSISSHHRQLHYEENGSITVYIQHHSPGAEIESNWLPAPQGPFNLMLRMYWPGTSVLAGQWRPPAVSRSF